jgi:hypothetical protein
VAYGSGHTRWVTDRGHDTDKRLARVALQTLGVLDARLTQLGCGLSSNAWLVADDVADRELCYALPWLPPGALMSASMLCFLESSTR